MANIEEKVESLIARTIIGLGYELYDVQYVKEGKDYYLRIFIDNKEKGISLEDCEKVNDSITNMLDEANYIKEQYFLEISSTGIEKIIRKDRHLQENIGKDINIKLFKAYDEQKEIIGNLKQYDRDVIVIQTTGKVLTIERKDISQMKKYYDWNLN